MSIETAIEKLADALNNLANAYTNAAAAVTEHDVAQPEAEAPKSGRKPKADAGRVQERMQGLQDEARAELPKEVVDAGTGEVVKVGGEPDAAALRLKAKDMGVRLIGGGGEADVANLLRKHAGIEDPNQKATFGQVPDAAIPALIADFEALASMAG